MKFTTEDKTEFYSMVKMCVTNGLTFQATKAHASSCE